MEYSRHFLTVPRFSRRALVMGIVVIIALRLRYNSTNRGLQLAVTFNVACVVRVFQSRVEKWLQLTCESLSLVAGKYRTTPQLGEGTRFL
jgi:hypothetical protein